MTAYITPNWPAPSTIKAYTTTRQSWGEPGCRAWVPGAMDALVNKLQLPSQPIWLKQYHSTVAVEALPTLRGADADASYTCMANHICMVETADCLPVLICNRQGTYVAAIHAGWRGLANGIIEATLQAAELPMSDLLVWLGPAIGPSKFEVGRDVYEAFVGHDAEAARCFVAKRERGLQDPGFRQDDAKGARSDEEKWLANLYELARLRLQSLGVTAIYGGDYCTHTQQDLFYSYRRDGNTTGRMASLIWIEAAPF